jgi:soluble lytic murein transglycosylase-like protein
MSVRPAVTWVTLAAAVCAAAAVEGTAPAAVRAPEPTQSRPALRQLVERVSEEHGLDFKLVDALVTVESGYNPSAVSHKGAQGLMQLMPDTARRLDVDDPFDPEQNVRGGIRELDRLIGRYSGNLQLALAAYNAGEGAVERYRGIPPYRETRDYVARIMSLYTGRPCRVAEGRLISPVRMTRDGDGRTVITNTSGSAGITMRVTRSTSGQGTLRGGFGTR